MFHEQKTKPESVTVSESKSSGLKTKASGTTWTWDQIPGLLLNTICDLGNAFLSLSFTVCRWGH